MSLQTVLASVQIVVSLAVGFHFLRSGLARIYRWFTALLFFEPIRVSAMLLIGYGTNLYAKTYVVTQPLLWITYALVMIEAFQTAFRTQPGIATVGRRTIAMCITGSALISAASSVVDLQHRASRYPILEGYLSLERVVSTSLFLFVLLLLVALTWLPILLTRNALIHACIFSVFFAIKTLIFLLRNAFGPDVSDALNWALQIVTVLSLCLWGVLLNMSGEQVPVKAGYRRGPADERRILAQLDALNRTLMGSAKNSR